MAEFCESCSKKFKHPPDYIFSEFESTLKPGFANSVICEGCGMLWIGKNEDNEMVFGYEDNSGNIFWESEPRKN
jgi:hypothetical protein